MSERLARLTAPDDRGTWTAEAARATLHRDAWRGRRVFLTGHTGFKGSWLAMWLHAMGAQVSGYALPPESEPSMFQLCNVGAALDSRFGDVREPEPLAAQLRGFAPEVVFHLAAQPLVRRGYDEPAATYATNVMGTAHLLDAVRQSPSVRAVVVVTTDKCYENMEWEWPYREDDRLGGHDPYSSSKAAAEILTASYRHAYFSDTAVRRHAGLIATVRAGNVIGGGDWSANRLVPDLVRAAIAGTPLRVRYPHATRPWQHVLEPLHGYLAVAEQLLAGDAAAATAWNFGPEVEGDRPVAWIAEAFRAAWGDELPAWELEGGAPPHEASRLALDWSRAKARLGWRPQWDALSAVQHTVEWYRLWSAGATGDRLRAVTLRQIERYSSAVLGAPA